MGPQVKNYLTRSACSFFLIIPGDSLMCEPFRLERFYTDPTVSRAMAIQTTTVLLYRRGGVQIIRLTLLITNCTRCHAAAFHSNEQKICHRIPSPPSPLVRSSQEGTRLSYPSPPLLKALGSVTRVLPNGVVAGDFQGSSPSHGIIATSAAQRSNSHTTTQFSLRRIW